ncbi:MAG: hypothetical protein MUF45_03570 [Spirosomaceae bacterium]|jgi:hypothetical protein|nr:hypothetical protein [Spirosomataceae bacterium]
MRKFFTILLIIIVVVVGILWLISKWSYSDGERAGTISKLSHRGFVFKTWEGVLNEGGYSGETGTLTPRYWDFSVLERDSTIKELQHAMKTGERITLKYEERVFKFPWNGDTKYFITDVEFLNRPQVPVQTLPQQPQQVVADTARVVSDTTKQ